MSRQRIPHSWVSVRLGDVALINPPVGRSDVPDEAPVSFVPMASVEEETGRLDATNTRRFGDLRRKSYRYFEEGDVIFAKITPCMENGKVALARGLQGRCAFGSTEFHVLRPLEGIASRYILHYVLQKSFRDEARRYMTGTAGQLRVPAKFLESAEIPLAPTAEQRRIVSAIEEQFSRVDAGVEALQRASRNLQRMLSAVLQGAVNGRLVPQNPDDEPAARFLSEGRGEAGPYPLPGGWLWARIAEIAEVQGGIQKQPKRRPGNNAYPFLRVANVLRSQLDLSDVHMIELFGGELDRYRLRLGDLLVVEGNGSFDQIGRSALWLGEIDPCVHQNHLIRVRPGPALNPNYLNVFWNAPSTAAAVQAVASSTSGLYTLSTAKVRRVLVAVPPVSEQERINLEVSRQLSLIGAARRVIDEVSGRARSLKATTLRHAFTGRLVPQDPPDEPAQVLLDRIKTARTAHESAAPRPRRRSS